MPFSSFLTFGSCKVVSNSFPFLSASNRFFSESSSPSRLPSSPSFAAIQRKAPRSAPVVREEDRVQDLEPSPSPEPTSSLEPAPSPESGPAYPSYSKNPPERIQRKLVTHDTPIVQGIKLVSLHELSDRFRSIFPFPLFNAVQSKCFQTVYNTDDNLVLSAPTGSGKTAVLEIAICRLVTRFQNDQFKIVYMAPTKSLCSERQRDWQLKLNILSLRCAELTGDTDHATLKTIQSADVIITTPEKWDSMTRKWKDHAKLMQLVKLFLIDEVHILKEKRGATLEAVVSRMKSVGSNVRFIALSATVPNSEDIATWLGQDYMTQYLPAKRERFGEEFRPVQLQKFVIGLSVRGNDFVFDAACDFKYTPF